jgi:hypothetical protein
MRGGGLNSLDQNSNEFGPKLAQYPSVTRAIAIQSFEVGSPQYSVDLGRIRSAKVCSAIGRRGRHGGRRRRASRSQVV